MSSFDGAPNRNRTGTPSLEKRRILSPQCLPISPSGPLQLSCNLVPSEFNSLPSRTGLPKRELKARAEYPKISGGASDQAFWKQKKALARGLWWTTRELWSNLSVSTALFGALARVFLVAGSHTTLQAHALTTAVRRQGHAGLDRQWRGEFTICFSHNLIAHQWLQ